MRAALALLLLGSSCEPAAEIACTELCLKAQPAQADCLDELGLSWEQSRWSSPQGFAESCETWIYTQQQLSRRAFRWPPGRADQELATACHAYSDLLDHQPACAGLDQIDWSRPAWESTAAQ